MAEVILALDVPDRDGALRLLDRLPDLRWVKLGSILVTAAGTDLIQELRRRELQVFLDLKWHDIPNTVAGAVRAAAELGVAMATVHTLGGPTMLRAAARAASPSLAVVGVTVLTSHEEAEYAATVGRPSVKLLDEASRLARSAISAELAEMVCSPLKVERIRANIGNDPLIMVPGIRRPGDTEGDQRRTASPAEAVRDGATHLVVGRPILGAPEPAGALSEFLAAAAG